MPRGLAFHLAAATALVIVFASLYPFSDWRDPGIAVLSFILKPLPRHILWGDFLINFTAYIPLGFFISTAAAPKFRHPGAFLFSSALCCLLSLGMESAQMYLPSRVASNVDWLANSAGGMIGALASMRDMPLLRNRLLRLRNAWFLQGSPGDAGIALLALWLFTQANPSLPLMGSWVLDEGQLLQRLFTPPRFSFAEASSIALSLFSFGLVISLMLKAGREKLPAVVTALFLAIAIKSASAVFLLKPDVFFAWANREAMAGTATGLAAIFFCMDLSPKTRVIIASLAILAQIGFTHFTPDIASPAAELFLFDWKYGQLHTLNGATSFLAELWPFLALAYLGFIYRKV